MKIDKFKNLFYYLNGKVGLEYLHLHKLDASMKWAFMQVNMVDGKTVEYNSGKVLRNSKHRILATILHELGHVKNQLPYNSKEQQIKSEYSAERFTLNYLKTYFPKTYTVYLKTLKSDLKYYKETSKIHYEAFKPIKEYREAMR